MAHVDAAADPSGDPAHGPGDDPTDDLTDDLTDDGPSDDDPDDDSDDDSAAGIRRLDGEQARAGAGRRLAGRSVQNLDKCRRRFLREYPVGSRAHDGLVDVEVVGPGAVFPAMPADPALRGTALDPCARASSIVVRAWAISRVEASKSVAYSTLEGHWTSHYIMFADVATAAAGGAPRKRQQAVSARSASTMGEWRDEVWAMLQSRYPSSPLLRMRRRLTFRFSRTSFRYLATLDRSGFTPLAQRLFGLGLGLVAVLVSTGFRAGTIFGPMDKSAVALVKRRVADALRILWVGDELQQIV
eukprot:g1135.t1